MKSNELRIGNLVTYNPMSVDKGTKIIPLTISCIDKEVGVILDDGFTNCYTWEEIMPILLSPEILDKCGIGFNTPKTALWNNDETILLGHLDGRFWYGTWGYEADETPCVDEIIEIKYLHQLQNLYFALTGEELVYKP